jgi:replicative DNA helicase
MTDQHNQDPIYAPESEQAVLGCILLDQQGCMPEVAAASNRSPDAFHDVRHKAIFEVMLSMDEAGGLIDLITLQQNLKDCNQLASAGGRGYLAELVDKVASAAMVGTYLSTVIDKWKLRNLSREIQQCYAKIQSNSGSADELINEIEGSIITATKLGRASKTTWQGGAALARAAIENIQQIFESDGGPIGIPTGFADLDKVCRGLQKTQLALIAARPSMGKTSLALNIAEHAAIELKLKVGIFSLETSTDLLSTQLIASMSRFDLRGEFKEQDFVKLTTSASRLAASGLFIDDVSMDIGSIRSKARQLRSEHGLDLLVVDYLQLATTEEGDKRHEKVGHVSRGLKLLAKELDIPIVALAQISRDVSKQDREPQAEDLKESGSLEQDADLIWMLHRRFGPEDDRDDWVNPFPVELIIRKQKQGPKNVVVPLVFHPKHTRFTSCSHERL